MTQNSSPQLAVANALVGLLTAWPELDVLNWAVGEKPGVLLGTLTTETGNGEIVDMVSGFIGGTIGRSSVSRGGDGQGIAQLVATYEGVPVHVWASYPLPDNRGLTAADLRNLLVARPLGALVCIPGGGK